MNKIQWIGLQILLLRNKCGKWTELFRDIVFWKRNNFSIKIFCHDLFYVLVKLLDLLQVFSI